MSAVRDYHRLSNAALEWSRDFSQWCFTADLEAVEAGKMVLPPKDRRWVNRHEAIAALNDREAAGMVEA